MTEIVLYPNGAITLWNNTVFMYVELLEEADNDLILFTGDGRTMLVNKEDLVVFKWISDRWGGSRASVKENKIPTILAALAGRAL